MASPEDAALSRMLTVTADDTIQRSRQRAAQHAMGLIRYEESGCCGFDCAYQLDVDDDIDGTLERWSVSRCELLGLPCNAARTQQLAEVWKEVNTHDNE